METTDTKQQEQDLYRRRLVRGILESARYAKGYPILTIADIHDVTQGRGFNLLELKELLRTMAREGEVMLSPGDMSLMGSQRVCDCGIWMQGQTMIQVQLTEKGAAA